MSDPKSPSPQALLAACRLLEKIAPPGQILLLAPDALALPELAQGVLSSRWKVAGIPGRLGRPDLRCQAGALPLGERALAGALLLVPSGAQAPQDAAETALASLPSLLRELARGLKSQGVAGLLAGVEVPVATLSDLAGPLFRNLLLLEETDAPVTTPAGPDGLVDPEAAPGRGRGRLLVVAGALLPQFRSLVLQTGLPGLPFQMSAGPPIRASAPARALPPGPCAESASPLPASAETDIHSLRRRLRELGEELQASETEVLRLAGRVARLDNLERELAAARDRVREAESEASARAREVELLKDRLARAEARIAALSDSGEELSARLRATERDGRQRGEEVKRQQEALAELEGKAEGLSRQLAAEQATHAELGQRALELQQAATALAAERDQAAWDRDQLLAAQRELRGEIDAVQERYAEQLRGADAARFEAGELKRRLEDTARELSTALDARDRHATRLKDIQRERDSLREERMAGEERLAELQNARDLLVTRVERLGRELEAATQRGVASSQATEERARLGEDLAAARARLDESQRAAHDAAAQLGRAEEENRRLRAERDSAAERGRRLEETLDASRRDLAARRQEVQGLTERLETLESLSSDLAEHERAKEMLSVRIRERDETLRHLDEQLKERTRRVSLLEDRLEQRETELVELRGQLADLRARAEAAQAELRGAREWSARMEADLAERREERQREAEEAAGRVAELTSRFLEAKDEAETLRTRQLAVERGAEAHGAELRSARELLARVEQELGALRQSAARDRDLAEERIAELREQSAQGRREAEGLQARLASSHQALEQAREALHDAESRASQAAQELQTERKLAAERSASATREIERLREAAEQMRLRIEGQTAEMQLAQESSAQLEQEAAGQQRRLEALHVELAEARARVERGDLERASLLAARRDVEALKEELQRRQTESASDRELQGQLRGEVSRLESLADTLRADLESERRRVEASREELIRTRVELERARDDADTGRQEVARLTTQLTAHGEGLSTLRAELEAHRAASATAQDRIDGLDRALQAERSRVEELRVAEATRAAATTLAADRTQTLEAELALLREVRTADHAAEEGEEVSTLRESLAAAERQLAEAQGHTARLSAARAEALETLSARSESFHRERTELLARLEQLTGRAERSEAELRGAHGLTARLEESLDDRQRRVSELETQFVERVEGAARAQEELRVVQRRVEELTEELRDLRAENDRLRVRATEGAERGRLLAEIAQERDRLRDEASRRVADLRAAEMERAGLSSRLQQTEARAEALQDALRDGQSRQAEQQAREELLRRAHEELGREAESLRGELRAREHQIAQLQQDLGRLAVADAAGAELATVLQDRGERLAALDRELEQERARGVMAAEQAARDAVERETLTDTLKNLAQEVEDLQDELRERDLELEQITDVRERLERELSELQLLEKDRNAALEELRAETEQARGELRGVRGALAHAQRAQEEIEEERRSRAAELASLRTELAARTTENETLRAALDEASAQRPPRDITAEAGPAASAAAQLEEAREALLQAQEQRSLELRQLRDELASIEEAGRASQLRLHMEIEVRATELEEAVRQLELREGEIWELTDAADRNAARVEASLANLSMVREELGRSREATASRDREIQSLRSELAALRDGTRIPEALSAERAELEERRRVEDDLRQQLRAAASALGETVPKPRYEALRRELQTLRKRAFEAGIPLEPGVPEALAALPGAEDLPSLPRLAQPPVASPLAPEWRTLDESFDLSELLPSAWSPAEPQAQPEPLGEGPEPFPGTPAVQSPGEDARDACRDETVEQDAAAPGDEAQGTTKPPEAD